ncbi:MAG: ABC transporter permease [Gammaproteobacteria bacterium]
MDIQSDTRIAFSSPDDNTLVIQLSGDWDLQNRLPATTLLEQALATHPETGLVRLEDTGIRSWDTSLPVFLNQIDRYCQDNQLETDMSALPEGVNKLLAMARAIPAIQDPGKHAEQQGLLAQVGSAVLHIRRTLPEGLDFIGECILSFVRLLRGKAQFRPSDLLFIIQQVGPNALPIVSLVSFLVGLILAYMGAVQLERVGAQIYIADLVSIAMVREIGALMTGIIMAGRTGASYAAELGTMQVNEEIDAFKTLGISTMDFLVLPRILALVLMIPLLTLYASLVGTVAGMFVAISVFDIGFFEYYQQTLRALELKQFWVGIFKGTVYGVVIAIAGCLRGIQCGRSALAVGEATTSAVVTSIVYIVVTASAMTIMLYKLDI